MSVREDETAAKAMGIDIAGYKLLVFVVGSFVAGIGGGVYAHYIGFLSPATFSFLAGFNPLIIVVFGGLGSMTGINRGLVRVDLLPGGFPARPLRPDGNGCADLAVRPLSGHPAASHADQAPGSAGLRRVGISEARHDRPHG